MTLVETIAGAQARGVAIRPKTGGFPYFAESLRLAGVTRMVVTVPSCTTVLITADGSVVQQGTPMTPASVEIPPFDVDGFVESLRAEQEGRITYLEWMEATWRAGVVWYEIDLSARTCTYRSPAGDSYVEHYAAIDLGSAPTTSAEDASWIRSPR